MKYLLISTVLLLSASVRTMAQNNQDNGGQPPRNGRQRPANFDPAQFQQRMIDRYREKLEITEDAEWKAIQPLIQNVLNARMALGTGGRGGFVRGSRGGADGNQPAPAQRTNPVRENPAAEELQKAVDAKVPAAEMKAALAKYIEYRKGKQVELDKARDALRAVLTSRQEAIATLSGLL
jgi:hypothetical protein